MENPGKVLSTLWAELKGQESLLDQVVLTGSEPVLPSSFPVGTLAQASIAAVGLAAAELWHSRTGRMQRVSVDMRHAATEFRSEKLFSLNGEVPRGYRDPLAGIYRCAGGGGLARI